MELKRAVTTWTELGYGRFSLHYLRNKEKEEVDFLIADGNTPFLIAEVKLSDDSVSPNLIKFQNMLGVPAVQLVGKEGIFKYKENDILSLKLRLSRLLPLFRSKKLF